MSAYFGCAAVDRYHVRQFGRITKATVQVEMSAVGKTDTQSRIQHHPRSSTSISVSRGSQKRKKKKKHTHIFYPTGISGGSIFFLSGPIFFPFPFLTPLADRYDSNSRIT